MISLEEAFSKIEDPRRKQGQRFSLPQLLAMTVLSYMCGHGGYRGTATFCKSRAETLVEEFGLKHGVPSHDTFWGVLSKLPSNCLIEAFQAWTATLSGDLTGEWVSADGKALASTVTDCQGSGQTFQAVVSLFVQKSQLAIAVDRYQNGKKTEGEGSTFRELLNHFKDQGIVFTADALHIQKNGG
jgi:hypothetical protein